MKKLVLVLTVVLVLSGIFAVAAFTSVEMDRQVTATVESDTNDNVAVYFQEGENYEGVFTVDNDGVVTINLENIFTGGFNPDADFVVGGVGQTNAVFGITNNSTSSAITVTIAEGEPIDLLGSTVTVTDGSATIGAGQEGWFHLGLDTRTISAPDTLTATLQIR